MNSPRSSTGTGTSVSPEARGHGAADRPGPASYRGRFAPSPTGPLHIGSLLAAAGSFLDARFHGGRWLVRIEDIDPPREVPGAADEILRALEAFDLAWDEEVVFQSRRRDAYDAALDALARQGRVFRCVCSRTDIAETNAARGQAGSRIYPGTCRAGTPPGRRSRMLRVRTGPDPVGLEDRLQGRFVQVLEEAVGDFVLRRRDGLIAYQLAVVVDDAWQGVTDVVRGIDLLDSTPRQLWVQQCLGLPAPRYMHLPVIVTPEGEKLSKQTGAPAVDTGRAGETAWEVLRLLGQSPPPELRGARPAELWDWAVPLWGVQHLAGRRTLPDPRAGFGCSARM